MSHRKFCFTNTRKDSVNAFDLGSANISEAFPGFVTELFVCVFQGMCTYSPLTTLKLRSSTGSSLFLGEFECVTRVSSAIWNLPQLYVNTQGVV